MKIKNTYMRCQEIALKNDKVISIDAYEVSADLDDSLEDSPHLQELKSKGLVEIIPSKTKAIRVDNNKSKGDQ